MKVLNISAALIALALFVPRHLSAQPGAERTAVLDVVRQFFDALEDQDTAVFRRICLKDARNYSVRDAGDSVVVRSHPSAGIRFNPKQKLKERMREAKTEVKIEGRIAMVWAPYDLWVNGTFSHCGVDVFTMIRTDAGWKIASIGWTVETSGCE